MDLCRGCKSGRMYLFFELGSHPPANQFLGAQQIGGPEPSFPLDAHVCLDCGLIQVPNHITPDFFRQYVYMPSASETLQRHFAGLASSLASRFTASSEDLIVDIGSNEGLFLGYCRNIGARALGVEPAANLTAIARASGLEVVNEYFDPSTADAIRNDYGTAQVIVTTNTFNHIDDLHGFMEAVTILLSPEAVFVVEVPHALDLVEKNEFDTIYHEHLSEFTVKSLVDLYRTFGLEIFDIERLEIHGGSMRVFAQRLGAGRPVSPVVENWLEKERLANLFSAGTYDAFRERVNRNREQLLSMLDEFKRQGKKVAGYGAPAKGNTLLNYFGIGTNYLDFLGDKNTLKQGLYSPGMHIPVVPAERIFEDKPDYVLILAWNFSEEILEQQAPYRLAGGKFILPIPEPAIV